ncbi:hypothetical protein [Vibrio phage RYC]|nr:hypothetical protein [Vibrio phage RYC]
MSYTYEAAGVSVNWYGLNLSEGWGEDTFLTITPNSERVRYKVGANGQYTFSKMADKGCTISMTFTDVAPVNKKVGGLAGAQDLIGNALAIAPFTVVDETGKSVHFICENAVLTEVSDIEFGAESGERTWTWVAETYIMAEDPATITAGLDRWIKASEAQESTEFVEL